MKTINVLAIAPYTGMAQLLTSIAANRREINLTVRIGNLREGLETARFLIQHNNYDVVLSRGGTAELLRRELNIFVIDVPISVYDILRCIKMAENYKGKYAITGFKGITENAQILCDLLQKNADVITFKSETEVLPQLRKLKEQSYSLVICDQISFMTAQSIGLNSIFMSSGTESINAALDTAVKFVQSTVTLYREKEIFKTALANQSEHTMIFDFQKNLWFSSVQDLIQEKKFIDILLPLLQELSNKKRNTFTKESDNKILNITIFRVLYDNVSYFLVNIFEKDSLFNEDDKIISTFNEWNEPSFDNLIHGSSASLVGNTQDLLLKYASTSFPVLIVGEIGTGKEKAASLLYKYGKNKNKPYYVIDCSKLTPRKWKTLLNSDASPLSELNATIHLKNISHLSELQLDELYNYIEDSNLVKRNRIIFSMVTPSPNAESIQHMLTNRLACLLLTIVPLRERREDIASIATIYINQLNTLLGKQIIGFQPTALELIQNYYWPNNLDQFHRVIKELVIITDSSYISDVSVRMILSQEKNSSSICTNTDMHATELNLNQPLSKITYDIIQLILAEENMNREKTAKRLGISRSTLWRILKTDL